MSIQLSPDRKWIWDGTRWLPIPSAAPPSTAPGVQEAAANFAPPPAGPSAPFVPLAYSPPAPQAPAPTYAAPAVEPVVTPLWEEPVRSGMSKYLYVVAGAVVLIMAMMFLNSQTFVQLPWQSSSETAVRPTPAPSPPPLLVRSEYARAGSFLTYTLAPALDGVNQSLTTLGQTCYGALSNSCLSAITATDKQVKLALAVIDRAEITPCIGVGMGKMRTDLAGMESSLQVALSGFKDNNKSVVDTGLARLASLTQTVHADVLAVNQAQKTQCSSQQIGP